MKETFLSIIVPVYNVEKYIKPCLKSILNAISQAPDYAFEIILIDDCGQDHSIKKVKKLQSQYPDLIRIESHAQNKGLGGARNTGIELTKGKYLQFVDSDDWLDQNIYQELFPTLIEHPEKVMVFGLEANKNGKKIWDYTPSKSGVISANKAVSMISRDELNVSACNKIFPRKAFSDFRFTEKMIYEDLDLIPLVFENSNGAVLFEKNYYFYRQDGESLTRTSTSDKHIKNGISATLNLYEKFNSSLAKGNILVNRWAYFLNKWNLSSAQKNDLLEVLTNTLEQIQLKEYDADQAQLFLKQINKLEKKVGSKPILQLKKAFLDSCFRDQNNDYIFSIIAPVYNNERYLKRFLDSINKDYKDFYEIIFVDDLSTDNSFHLIQQAAENNSSIKAFKLPEKGGAGGARNFGLDQSSGQYVIFLDSDDWISPNFFDEIVDSLIINQNIDMLIYGFDVVDQTGDISWSSTKIFNLPYFDYSGEQTFQMFLDEVVNPSPWNKVIKKNLLEPEKIRFPKHIYHQDLALIPYLIRISEKIGFIKKPLYNYFINNEGISQTATQKHIDSIFQAVDFLFNLMEHSGLNYDRDQLIKMALLNFNYNLQLRKNQYTNEQILNFRKQLVDAFKKYEVNLEHILYNFHGRELFGNLKFEFDSRGLDFSLSEAILNVDIDHFIEQFNLIYNQMDLSLQNGGSSMGYSSSIEANNLKDALAWYSRTYDHLPKWYLKPGGVFRRKPFNKLKKKK